MILSKFNPGNSTEMPIFALLRITACNFLLEVNYQVIDYYTGIGIMLGNCYLAFSQK
ncbi:MAG: hypothetical protein PHS66_05695 [Candidatus Omnitrophica bacterium]|nr:hypothetical protein [Candidatus Omnitrophota bacterium]